MSSRPSLWRLSLLLLLQLGCAGRMRTPVTRPESAVEPPGVQPSPTLLEATAPATCVPLPPEDPRLGVARADDVLENHLVEDAELLALPAWLASQPSLRMFFRDEVASGTWLSVTTLGSASERTQTTACLEQRTGQRCWAHPGQVVDVSAWDFLYGEPADLEEAPEGILELELANGGVDRVAFRARSEGGLESADVIPPARWMRTRRHRPSWMRTATVPRTASTSEMLHPTYRPVTPRPFPFPAVPNVHSVEPFAGGRVLVTRTMLAESICARLATPGDPLAEAWACSPPNAHLESGHRYDENRVVDALVLGPTTLGVARATLEIQRTPDGRGEGLLEIYEATGGTLVRRGALLIGAISWRNGESSGPEIVRTVTRRLFHRVTVESEGCVRIAEPENFAGDASVDFTPRDEGWLLHLARAGEEVLFTSEEPAGVDRPLLDLAGTWQVTGSGISRVAACGNGPSTRLVPPRIPPALGGAERRCLEDLARESDAQGPLPRIATGPSHPCGARIQDLHGAPSFLRFVYAGDRLTHSIEVTERAHDTHRSVERELYRGASHVGQARVSTHYRGGLADCVNTRRASYRRDGLGRILVERATVQSCEGVDSGVFVVRYVWAQRREYDQAVVWSRHESDDRAHRVRRTYVPTQSAPEAMAQAEDGDAFGTCWLDVRDEQGHLRERLHSTGTHWEYAYQCEGPEWPTPE